MILPYINNRIYAEFFNSMGCECTLPRSAVEGVYRQTILDSGDPNLIVNLANIVHTLSTIQVSTLPAQTA